MVVGRVPECDIRLDHPRVSRQHARFERPDGRWRIVDLNSHNGTRLNKNPVREAPLANGDGIEIGPFTLTFHHGPPGSGSSWVAAVEQTLMVSESAVPIRTLREIQPPSIALEHLNGLDEFSRVLLDTPDAADRAAALCRLMVQSRFGGKWSTVVSVDRSGGPALPRVVSPLQFADGILNRTNPYLSRSLLQAACRRAEAVLASNVAGGTGSDANIELSIAPDVMQLTAIAIPLPGFAPGNPTQLELLYAVFPPQYGTGEWLALSSLAVNHYRQAQTIWANIQRNRKLAAIEADLERARLVQHRLVPKHPQLPGLEIAIRFNPCHAVGGDYADVLPLTDGRALLVVADVCGKGLSAAMVAMGLHTLVHAAARRWSGLADLAFNVTAHLNESLSSDSFVTFMAMTLNPATGGVEVVNAGHPASLVVDGAGASRRVGEATSSPLGTSPIPPDVEHFTLAENQTMVLFTDGAFDVTTQAGQMLGVEGFCELAVKQISTNSTDANGAADRVNAALDEVQGSRSPADDRTLLLVRLSKAMAFSNADGR
jgi:serine phosphatase RsbU (regulator of sigma subunit)